MSRTDSLVDVDSRLQAAITQHCTHFTPHAWIFDRCRDCGRSESVHATSVNDVSKEASRPAPGLLNFRPDGVGMAPTGGSHSRTSSSTSSTSSTHAHARTGSKAFAPPAAHSVVAQETIAEGDDGANDASTSPDAPTRALSVREELSDAVQSMDTAVDAMARMEQEFEEIKAREQALLAAQSISQVQYDELIQNMQRSFEVREKELKEVAEQARARIAETEARLKLELESDAVALAAKERSLNEALAEADRAKAEAIRAKEEALQLRQQAEAEAARLRAEADATRAEMEQLRQGQADAARALAEQTAAAREQERIAAQEALDQVSRAKQVEIDAAAQRATAAEQEAERARREADQSKQAAQEAQVGLTTDLKAKRAAFDLPSDDNRPQPTSASSLSSSSSSSSRGPYKGTVNLNDVLLRVEKTFLQGRNLFRYKTTGDSPVTIALFLRVINDEYTLCWSKADDRTVDETRQMSFGSITAIVIGKQSSVLRRAPFEAARDGSCISFVGKTRTLHLQAASDRDAEMTAFGLASLMKEARLMPPIFDAGQYHEEAGRFDVERQQEEGEADDGSAPTAISDVDVLSRASVHKRYTVELKVRCTNLPPVHQNYVVCLVDREERSEDLVYISQTEKISKTTSPDFKKLFVVDVDDAPGRILRFNVYDVNSASKALDESDRVGSVKVDVKEIVDHQGINMVYILVHRDQQKNGKLQKNGSWITVQCVSKKEITEGHTTPGRGQVDLNELRMYQSMLIKGDTFLSHSELAAPKKVRIYYRVLPESSNPDADAVKAAEEKFTIGHLYWADVGADGSSASASATFPMRTLTDVYIGKKHRAFATDVPDEQCFSLLSRSGLRLDLTARHRQQRDEWVNAITSLLKHEAAAVRARVQAKLGAGKAGAVPAQ